jgi:hypothetical protein
LEEARHHWGNEPLTYLAVEENQSEERPSQHEEELVEEAMFMTYRPHMFDIVFSAAESGSSVASCTDSAEDTDIVVRSPSIIQSSRLVRPLESLLVVSEARETSEEFVVSIVRHISDSVVLEYSRSEQTEIANKRQADLTEHNLAGLAEQSIAEAGIAEGDLAEHNPAEEDLGELAEVSLDAVMFEAAEEAAHEEVLHSALDTHVHSLILSLLEKELSSLATRQTTKTIETEVLERMITQTAQEIFRAKLPAERFRCEIDPYFLCKRCKGVVKDPVQCNACEELLCLECVINPCPSGCPEIAVGKVGKFASLVYERLLIACKHSPTGCTHTTSIKLIPVHEANCQYSTLACENPMCPHTFRLIDRPASNQTCCSDLCSTVSQFNRALMASDKIATLHKFTELLNLAKSALKQEVAIELTKDYDQLTIKRAELNLMEEERRQVARDLFARRINFHPGKWSSGSRTWSCCKSREMYVIGCKEFS